MAAVVQDLNDYMIKASDGNGGMLGTLSAIASGTYKSNGLEKIFRSTDNYIYIYHTDTTVLIPTYPESIQDSMGNNFSATNILSRSAPVQTYISSGPRTVQIGLKLHRDMMFQINHDYQYSGWGKGEKKLHLNFDQIDDEDYIDKLTRELQAIAVPKYIDASKMVNPPQVAVKFGNDIFIRGVVSGNVGVNYNGVILRTNKYSNVDISFEVTEIDPYDAETVAQVGSYRGISKTLQRKVYKN